MLKMEIRIFTICYCKQIARSRKNDEAVLMCANPAQAETSNILWGKTEGYTDFNAQGAMIRSKPRWREQVERSTRYFFNLENLNRFNKHITKLKAENRSLVGESELKRTILTIVTSIFKELDRTRSNNNPHLLVFLKSVPSGPAKQTLFDTLAKLCNLGFRYKPLRYFRAHDFSFLLQG